MFVICGSMVKDKVTSKGNTLHGYVLYVLDQSKREGVKGITSFTVWISTEMYINLSIDDLINSKALVEIRYNRYGYIDTIQKV